MLKKILSKNQTFKYYQIKHKLDLAMLEIKIIFLKNKLEVTFFDPKFCGFFSKRVNFIEDPNLKLRTIDAKLSRTDHPKPPI